MHINFIDLLIDNEQSIDFAVNCRHLNKLCKSPPVGVQRASRAPHRRCDCCQSTTRCHAHRGYRKPSVRLRHTSAAAQRNRWRRTYRKPASGVYGEWSFVRRPLGAAIKALGRRLADNRTSGRKEKEVHRPPVGYEQAAATDVTPV